jgi:peptidoglycan/xylan/chitin deacetylase (PgdA/CDA1 family)
MIGTGLVTTRLHRTLLHERGLVVAFHRVNDDLPEDSLTRSSKDFERFCRFFKTHFDVTTLEDIIGRLRRRESIAGKVAITFDDGYRGNFETAAPILNKLGLSATFFVVTRFLGTNIVPWWDRALPIQPGWMTWDQVKQLDREGFHIGAHTQTHVDLGVIDGIEAEAEIHGSRDDLLAELGRPATLFAYPYGQRNNMLESNRARVKDAGFQCCVSCFGGLALGHDDPYRLHRMPVGPWFRTPEQLVFEVLMRRM